MTSRLTSYCAVGPRSVTPPCHGLRPDAAEGGGTGRPVPGAPLRGAPGAAPWARPLPYVRRAGAWPRPTPPGPEKGAWPRSTARSRPYPRTAPPRPPYSSSAHAPPRGRTGGRRARWPRRVPPVPGGGRGSPPSTTRPRVRRPRRLPARHRDARLGWGGTRSPAPRRRAAWQSSSPVTTRPPPPGPTRTDAHAAGAAPLRDALRHPAEGTEAPAAGSGSPDPVTRAGC